MVVSPVLFNFEPVPSTVAVPEEPGFWPITVVVSVTVPPLVIARVPVPSTPVATVPVADKLPPLTAAPPLALQYRTPLSGLATDELPCREAPGPLLSIAGPRFFEVAA